MRIQVDILPKDQADMNKVGSARTEPNMNPYLPPPVGRMSLTLNPFKMFVSVCSVDVSVDATGGTQAQEEDLLLLLHHPLLCPDCDAVPSGAG